MPRAGGATRALDASPAQNPQQQLNPGEVSRRDDVDMNGVVAHGWAHSNRRAGTVRRWASREQRIDCELLEMPRERCAFLRHVREEGRCRTRVRIVGMRPLSTLSPRARELLRTRQARSPVPRRLAQTSPFSRTRLRSRRSVSALSRAGSVRAAASGRHSRTRRDHARPLTRRSFASSARLPRTCLAVSGAR
jgi:hypothetical protein